MPQNLIPGNWSSEVSWLEVAHPVRGFVAKKTRDAVRSERCGLWPVASCFAVEHRPNACQQMLFFWNFETVNRM
jgi:hypothetical protein